MSSRIRCNLDGLEDAYDPGKLMGSFAEDSARDYQFTRGEQDDYALESLRRATAAIDGGAFTGEIVAVQVPGKGAPDERRYRRGPGQGAARQDPDAETRVQPRRDDHGGQRLVDQRRRGGARPDACVGRAGEGADPGRGGSSPTPPTPTNPGKFTTAPVPAIQKVLDKAGWSVADVDLFEVNEAFAVVAMIAMRDLGIPREKLNVHGGATALGHPIGASGARIHGDADRRAPSGPAAGAASPHFASAAARRRRSRSN